MAPCEFRKPPTWAGFLIGSAYGFRTRDLRLGDRELRRQLRVNLTRELGPGVIKDVKFSDSKRDVLCQLADMVAGAIRLAHDDPRREGYREMIEARLQNVWKFGW